jgi:potassium intermediate/small conductance calcium-activated channel subfamily N member 3
MTATEFFTSLPISQTSSKTEYDEHMAVIKMKNQLIERKELHFRCQQVNDITCIIAVFGIVLMIIDTELRFNQTNGIMMIFIRPLIGISTIVLMGFVLYYHVLDIRLYAINNHIADWRVTITIRAILLIVFEVLVCAIHPFPYQYKASSNDSA